MTVVKHVQPGSPEVKVVSKQCTDDPVSRPVPKPHASSSLITTFYDDLDFQGSSDEVWGDEGPCDSVGYGFSDLSSILDGWVWDGGISSYKLHSGCNKSLIFSDYNFQGLSDGYDYDVPALSSGLNDNVYSMRTWTHPMR